MHCLSPGKVHTCINSFMVHIIYMYTLTLIDRTKIVNCGIIICGGAMFMAFMGNPSQRFYIPINLYTSNCLKFIKIIQDLHPTKLHPHEPAK